MERAPNLKSFSPEFWLYLTKDIWYLIIAVYIFVPEQPCFKQTLTLTYWLQLWIIYILLHIWHSLLHVCTIWFIVYWFFRGIWPVIILSIFFFLDRESPVIHFTLWSESRNLGHSCDIDSCSQDQIRIFTYSVKIVMYEFVKSICKKDIF